MSISRFLLAALITALAVGVTSDTSLAELNTVTTLSTFASDSSMVLDASGNPVVAYRDSLDTRLRVLHCDDPFCTGGGESLIMPEVQSGQWPSIILDASGNPVVSYYTTPFDRIKLLRCDDPNCVGSESITTPEPQAFLLNHSTSLAIDADGNPVIAYALWAPFYELRIMHCNDPNCEGGDESITVHDSFAAAPSLTLDAAGNPVVAYYRDATQIFSSGTLRVMHCNDPDCAGGDETTTSPEPATGVTPSLKLDAAGNPVIAYYTGISTRDLKVMHCNDANCAGSNESITTPDSAGDVGSQPSLALSGDNPIVSYRDVDNDDLKFLYCNDPNCAPGGDTVVPLDTALDSGENSSVIMDGSGLPAITYDAGTDLRLIRCGDADCAETVGGLSELAPSISATDATFPLLWWLIASVVGLGAAMAGLFARHRLAGHPTPR
jgi:hypothetical protein